MSSAVKSETKEKDEACLGFLENIFTKSVHRGGVNDDAKGLIFFLTRKKGSFKINL